MAATERSLVDPAVRDTYRRLEDARPRPGAVARRSFEQPCPLQRRTERRAGVVPGVARCIMVTRRPAMLAKARVYLGCVSPLRHAGNARPGAHDQTTTAASAVSADAWQMPSAPVDSNCRLISPIGRVGDSGPTPPSRSGLRLSLAFSTASLSLCHS